MAAIGCLVPTAATAASAKFCVGLFVDGTSDAGSRAGGCVHVSSGSTGIDVLQAAGDELVTQDDGDFVCSINGVPASGCAGIDGTHYWSYWHRAVGATAWGYSSEGAGSYEPTAGSSEGWVYDNGDKLSPTHVGQLCPVNPTTTATPSAARTTAKASPRPTASNSPTTTPTAPTSSSPATAATSRAVSKRLRQSRRPKGIHSASLSPSSAAEANTAEVAGGGSPWGLITGLAIVAVLGGGAIWQSRRRRR